jgi:hypothetical protein
MGTPVPTLIGGPPPTQLLGSGPTGTALTQRPLAQPCPSLQALPQPPQLALSLSRSAQVWAQTVRPGKQPEEQTPAEHTSLAAQAVPQAPQFCGSVLVGMQEPAQRELYSGQPSPPAAELPASPGAPPPMMSEPPFALESPPAAELALSPAELPEAPPEPLLLLPQETGATSAPKTSHKTIHARTGTLLICCRSSTPFIRVRPMRVNVWGSPGLPSEKKLRAITDYAQYQRR